MIGHSAEVTRPILFFILCLYNLEYVCVSTTVKASHYHSETTDSSGDKVAKNNLAKFPHLKHFLPSVHRYIQQNLS